VDTALSYNLKEYELEGLRFTIGVKLKTSSYNQLNPVTRVIEPLQKQDKALSRYNMYLED
jgi:hypothetical protein